MEPGRDTDGCAYVFYLNPACFCLTFRLKIIKLITYANAAKEEHMADSNITKNALASSLKSLMEQKPFQKINVNDICEGCGMNRKSFYYHFKDKYDLVNWIFYTEFVSHIHVELYDNGWDLLVDVCRYFESERNFYRCALAIKGQNSFQDYFLEIIRPLIPIFLSDSLKTSEDQQFLLSFFYDGLISSLIRWLSEENETTAEEFTGHLKSVLLLFAEEIFNNLKDTPSAPQPD